MTREDAASKRSVRVNDGNSKDIKVVRCNITLDTKTKFLFIVPITNYHASYYDNHKTIEQRYAAATGKKTFIFGCRVGQIELLSGASSS